MERITVTLTKDQVKFIADVVEMNWATRDTPARENMFDIRIVNKLRKALADSTHKTSVDLINAKLKSGELKLPRVS